GGCWMRERAVACSDRFSGISSTGTATTEIYTLSLHDALPIWIRGVEGHGDGCGLPIDRRIHRRFRQKIEQYDAIDARVGMYAAEDRKSTRLNSSHLVISYAVFCLKKKIHAVSVCLRGSLPSML